MSRLSLTAEFVCGTRIEDACKEAIVLATKLGVDIKFDFNDILVIAYPNVCPIKLATECRRVQREEKIKVAIVI